MSKKSNFFLSISFLFLMQNGVCMDPPLGSSPSSGWGLSNSGTFSTWSFNPFSAITSAVSSAVATVNNKLSDGAALQKLGFPLTDSYAHSELAKCKQLYVDVVDPNKRHCLKEMLERVLRRTGYLTRIFCILPMRPDFHEVVPHCTSNHGQAMSVFLKDCYNAFLREKLALYNKLSEEMNQLDVSQDHKQKLAAPAPPPPSSLSSGVFSDAYSLQITVPTVAGATQFLCDSASSLYQTAKNELSDAAAFKKLGWPHNDSDAQRELRETNANYEKISTVTNHEERIDLLSFVLRRTEYLVRAFLALPHCPDAFEFAQFLMKNHSKAMFPLLLALFTRFTASQRQAVQSASNSLLKNSGSIMVNKIDCIFGKAHYKSLQEIKNSFEQGSVVLLKQQHGIQGCVVNDENYRMDFQSVEGDFLATNKPDVMLGVLTADCLPIIFHDKKNNAVGIAHAGWKGSVANIVKAVLESMHRNYETKAADVSIVFGPCIHQCCYEVKSDLIPSIGAHGLVGKTIIKRNETYFFDLLAFNKALLIALGVNEFAIDDKQSKCTKCNPQYYSHRRGCQKEERQLSYVWIKK